MRCQKDKSSKIWSKSMTHLATCQKIVNFEAFYEEKRPQKLCGPNLRDIVRYVKKAQILTIFTKKNALKGGQNSALPKIRCIHSTKTCHRSVARFARDDLREFPPPVISPGSQFTHSTGSALTFFSNDSTENSTKNSQVLLRNTSKLSKI